jgi:hypothetical protein
VPTPVNAASSPPANCPDVIRSAHRQFDTPFATHNGLKSFSLGPHLGVLDNRTTSARGHSRARAMQLHLTYSAVTSNNVLSCVCCAHQHGFRGSCMTLVLSFTCTDGVAILSDTRKWLRAAQVPFVDGHAKVVRTGDGLLTGYGCGELLDEVAGLAGGRSQYDLPYLLVDTTARWMAKGERADWVMSFESPGGEPSVMAAPVSLAVVDNLQLKPAWMPVNLPQGLEDSEAAVIRERLEALSKLPMTITQALEAGRDIYGQLHANALVSSEFDFGTHKPGHQVDVVRMMYS